MIPKEDNLILVVYWSEAAGQWKEYSKCTSIEHGRLLIEEARKDGLLDIFYIVKSIPGLVS